MRIIMKFKEYRIDDDQLKMMKFKSIKMFILT